MTPIVGIGFGPGGTPAFVVTIGFGTSSAPPPGPAMPAKVLTDVYKQQVATGKVGS